MNISQISFCGSNQSRYGRYESTKTSSNPYVRKAASTRENLRTSSGIPEDDYTFTTRKSTRKNKKLNPWKAACIGLALANVINFAAVKGNNPQDAATITAPAGTSIIDIADIYGVDADIIQQYNHLDSDYITYSTELIIPTEYDYIGDEIESLKEDLYRKSTSQEERAEIEERIQALQNKQTIQQQIAQCYTDGEYIYFKITLPKDDTATSVQQEYKYGINVEEFKFLFDIKDSAIKDNNNISFTWDSDEYGGFQNYSTETLRDGQVIKVPMNAIKTNNIQLYE